MNVAQALAITAAALVVAIGPERISTASAQAAGAMQPAAIRAAADELAELMERNYVFPDAARQYADHLRRRAAEGAYDGISDPQELAETLETELRRVHDDAHLRIGLAEAEGDGPRLRRGPSGAADAISDVAWLADGVGYFRINGLPSTDASVAQMTSALDQLATAQTLIIDVRRCPGGALREMDVLFSRLYAAPTRVMIMDTRTDAAFPLENRDETRLRRVSAPAGITRDEHWAQPTSPVSPLADARVFLLTGRTGSACEHLSQALRETGRATLVGTSTGGAGHYGGMRRFGDGRFEIFLPVGNSYAPGAQSWEGVGVQPHRAVAEEEALNEVLREINVPLSAAANVAPFAAPVRRVVQGEPGRRAYGIGVLPPRGGESSIRVEEVAPGMVAAESGIRAGDRIVSINGVAISDMAPADFPAMMRSSPMTMVVERDGERLTFEMSRD